MDELDHDYRIYTTPRAGDETLYVKFFIDAVQDTAASKAAGRPIYKDAEWIDIRTPNSRDAVIRPCRPDDYERFPKHYDAFKRRIGNEEQIIGTPLSTWPWHGMTRSRIEELKHFNIRTVEQVAGMSDSGANRIMGFYAMKQAAQAYLETVKTSAPVARLQAQLEQAMAKLAEQGLEIARLQARAQGLPEPKSDSVTVPLQAQIQKELSEVKPIPLKPRRR